MALPRTLQTSQLPESKDILNCPLFFKVEKDSHTSYILGTRHIVPFSILPETFIAIIRQAKSLVLESTKSIKLSRENLYDIGILTRIESYKWFEKLPPKTQIIFARLSIRFFNERTDIKPPSFNKINPELAHIIVLLSNRPHEYIDSQLESLFPQENGRALEGLERFEK